MMKNIIIIICASLLPMAAGAQINLILNPQFEQYSVCPDNIDEAKYCNYWMSLDSAWSPPDWIHAPLGVPEYCNMCATYFDVSVPYNGVFNHYPHSGKGMMQVQMFSYAGAGDQQRDYLQGHLSQTLLAGHKYNVRLYTALEQLSGYQINHIGAYFDNGMIDTTHNPGHVQSQYIPQILDTAILTDTTHWTKIEDTFTANGTERLITIGQFTDATHTNYNTISGTGYAWYLIDDVSVIDCSNVPFAGRDTTLVTPTTDSVFLGSHESLLPYTWYVLDSTNPIDSGGGIWVHPTVTTSYVLVQKLCGITRTDTVTVHVRGVGINEVLPQFDNLAMYPNPVTNELTIDGAKNCEVVFYDVVGKEMLHDKIVTAKQVLDVGSLPKGVYLVKVADPITGESVTKRLMKE